MAAFIPVREYRQDRRVRRPRAVASAPEPTQVHVPDADRSFNPFSDGLLPPSQLLSQNDDDLVVREFEQHGSDKSTRRQIEPNKELRDEAEEVWQELQDVEKQLEIAREGPFGPRSEFMQQFPPDKREEFLKALAKEGVVPQDEEDTLDLAELDRLMEQEDDDISDQEELGVTLHIPRAHQSLAARFNKALVAAKEGEDDVVKGLNLWKWYLRCQQRIPGFSQIVSEKVWKFLWQSQIRLGKRPQHLVMLGRDMRAVDEPMDNSHCLEYIRAMHASDDTMGALFAWEEMKSQLGSDTTSEFLSAFYSTGTQLHVSVGRTQKAQRIAFAGIEKGAEPTILIHVISGWAQMKTADSANKAWGLYLRMRKLLKDDMTPELYEKVSDALLDAKQGAMALAAFKDMIARLTGTGRSTLDNYEKILGNVRLDGDPEEVERAINRVSLTMLLVLPRSYQNKFFFASWVKKLLGQQRTEAAAMVVELMYERNIRPDALHLNGILGAWLRDKSAKSREKAVKLAHEMIQMKVNINADRAQNRSLRQFGDMFRKVMPFEENNNSLMNPVRLERRVPAANRETFALMFSFYAEKQRWKDFESLTRVMIGPAQLMPSNFIMNLWLSAELESKSLSRFWTLYNSLQSEVRPNMETFSLAWQAVTLTNRAGHRYGPQDQLKDFTSSHRRMFARIVDWTRGLKAHPLRKAREWVEGGLYTEIVRSFCLQLDLAGTICALQGLYSRMNATPDDVSVRLITGMVARLLPRSAPDRPLGGGRRRMNSGLQGDQTMLKNIADIVATIEANMKIDLVESGQVDPAEIEDVQSVAAKKLRLDVMTEFLVTVMNKIKKHGGQPGKELKDAARIMHVNVSHIDVDLKAHGS
ncbi:hypothetical protein OHC33_008049 [Knufia fluminis]|uniref:Pentatricopeptide repeat-containing protein n=1 Tax=Knufia fluminis TaxID=191047 RepID=A0AAN8IKA6_9EURO|nr:hypothetical protein OHC33_008049 [Knufia fluminis]